jgi:RNA-directed DNA polymerase
MMNNQLHSSGGQRMNTAKAEEQQAIGALLTSEALTVHLMEEICEPLNLYRAYGRVVGNKGAAGCDGMQVKELAAWIKDHKVSLINSLLNGTYQPKPVRGVEIPKPGNKGVRQLGIPNVVDRFVQQAILQVLEPIYDPTFSESSYGFRPKRSAHQALKQAQAYVQAGYEIVVDIDLEKFFDRVNHDILMSRLAKRINDKRLLKIIRRFLEAGLMNQGVCIKRTEGVPQGGPLSPLMSNILLDELDKELEKRGHKFCRYADDCNIYVQSLRAGERVLQSIKQFLEKRLKLKVNETKSGCAVVDERKFLGYRLLCDGKLIIADVSIERIRNKIRTITRRNRGIRLEEVISELNIVLRGWINYFGMTQRPSELMNLDGWIRRKLRCYRLKQRKAARPIAKLLLNLGVGGHSAWNIAKSGKGWWRLSSSVPVQQAMNNKWFKEQGLLNLTNLRALLTV